MFYIIPYFPVGVPQLFMREDIHILPESFDPIDWRCEFLIPVQYQYRMTIRAWIQDMSVCFLNDSATGMGRGGGGISVYPLI